jgi:RNA polymerase sigma factor (sigma-70 family)
VTVRSETVDFAPLVERALAGDPAAWTSLVEALKRVVWKAVMSFDLEPEERDDAFSMTFLRLYERLGTVREPHKLPGWITTVSRNEVYAILRARRRFQAAITSMTGATPLSTTDEVDEEAGLRAALREAVAELPELSQKLLRLLMADPPLPYSEIAATLGIPVGSIGPTRQRCLDRLRHSPALAQYLESVTS